MEPTVTSGISAKFARDLNQHRTETERLNLGVQGMVELVDGCDYAGITMSTRTGFVTPAATDELVLTGDRLQYELNEGPCVDSVRFNLTVLSENLLEDRRWPRWGPTMARMGVLSMMSLLLFTHEESLGAVNLYAKGADGFGPDAFPMAQALAAHLAVGIAAGREIDHRGAAILSRTVIGQAEGILMERFKITAEEAFGLLRSASKNTNRKLVSIAEELVRTGELVGQRTPDGQLLPEHE